MNTALSIAIDEAFFQARKALNEEAPTEAFSWLERAHILSQRMPGSVLMRRCLFHRSCSDFFKEKCNEVVS